MGLDSRELGNGAHGEEHFIEQAPADCGLRISRGDVQAADQAFLVLQNIEGVAGGAAIFESGAPAERVGFQKAFDEIERAAIVPMEFVTPVTRLFLEQEARFGER